MKIRIEVNNYIYKDDIIYGALSLCGGNVVKRYIGEDGIFTGNFAFHNVLFNYLREKYSSTGYKFFADRSVSYITFSTKKEKFISFTNDLLGILFNNEYEE